MKTLLLNRTPSQHTTYPYFQCAIHGLRLSHTASTFSPLSLSLSPPCPSIHPSSPCPGAVWAYRTPSRRWATRPSRSVLPPCPPQLLTSRASACLTWWWGCSTTPRTPSPGWGKVSEAHAVTPNPGPVSPNSQNTLIYVNKLFFAVLQLTKKTIWIDYFVLYLYIAYKYLNIFKFKTSS